MPLSERKGRTLSVAAELAGYIKCQILTGVYLPGQQLPTATEMADRFNVDPNTARAAYARLREEGLVNSIRGKGTFVCQDGMKGDPEKLRSLVSDIIEEAAKIGLSPDELATIIWVHSRFAGSEPGIWYVDDWHPYFDTFAADLQAACDLPVIACTLDLFEERIAKGSGPRPGAFICVTRFNYDRVAKLISDPSVRMIAVTPHMAPETLEKLSQLSPDTRLGVVCVEEKFAKISGKVIQKSGIDLPQVHGNTTDITTLPKVIDHVDAITISTIALGRLEAAKVRLPPIPTIPFSYRITEDSLAAVVAHIAENQAATRTGGHALKKA